MTLHTVVALKKLGFAKMVVTGAFINGALIGAGLVTLAAGTAVAARSARKGMAPRDDAPTAR